MKENICILRVIINLGHVKELSKHNGHLNCDQKPAYYQTFPFHSKGFSDTLNTTSTAVMEGYQKEIPDLCPLQESIVGD